MPQSSLPDSNGVVFISRPHLPALAVALSSEQPEILFVHGCTETADIWALLMQALAQRGVHSAAVDLRGHGRSGGQESLQAAGIRDYVADAKSVFECFPTLKVAVGHSMGGLITQLLAAELRLHRAVLVASSPVGGMRDDGRRMARKHPWTFLMASLQRSFRRLYRKEAVARSLLFHADAPQALIRSFLSNVQEDSWIAGNEMNTLLPDPSAVACPVTVIGGGEDFMVSRASTEATAAAYRTKAIFIEGCAHMVPIEADPGELAELLIQIIR